MLILFGVLKIELNVTGDIIIGLIDGKFESLSFFVSVLEDFLLLFFIEDDNDVDSTRESAEEAGDFFLNK
jgi:hypothetical protein